MLVGYMRVSSDSDRQTTDLQRDALLSTGVDDRHLFTDRASGARDDRPGLKLCLDYLKPGDTLVVWKLDRLGRSLPHLLDIVARLRENGVSFRSLTEQMDTTTPHGELIFHIFGALAQYERALTRERVKAGKLPPSRAAMTACSFSGEIAGGRPPCRPRRRAAAMVALMSATMEQMG
jgi:DNA invertase Pin-like site-specific DNA recombinase